MNTEIILVMKDIIPLLAMVGLVFFAVYVLIKHREPNEVSLVSGGLYIDTKHFDGEPNPCNHAITKIDQIAISDLGDGFYTKR